MNRKIRRELLAKGHTVKSVMDTYRAEAVEQGFQEGMRHSIETTFNILAYTLTYKTGYSTARIKQLLHDVYFNIDSFRTDHLTSEDYLEICKELDKKGISFHETMKGIK